jgi:hypothetical protein
MKWPLKFGRGRWNWGLRVMKRQVVMWRGLLQMKVEKLKVGFKGGTVIRVIHEDSVPKFAWMG